MNGLVLVTGAAGAVGARLTVVLRERGWAIRALVHESDVEGADETVLGDLTDSASLGDAVAGVDGVVHLGAVTHARDADSYERVNVGGTRNLLNAAERARVRRFIHVSTRAIGEQGGAYSRSKYRAELAVERSGLDATIVRLPEVYGADGREGIDRIIGRVREGRYVPIVGRGTEHVCPIHVDDAVAALAEALASDATSGKTYTLAGPCLTLAEFVRVCSDVFSTEVRLFRVPTLAVVALSFASRFLPLPIYPDQLARLRVPKPPGSPEAHADLSFRPLSLVEGLRRVAV